MPYKADPLSQKLDKVAEATGFPQFSKRVERGLPVRFRFIPLVLLAAAVAGLWVQAAVSEMFGYVILMFAWGLSWPLQQFSALRPSRPDLVDERERALIRSGHFAGLVAALGTAVLGCIAFGLGSAANMIRMGHFWAPASVTDWLAIALVLLAVESNVAVLAASSALPEPLDDEDGDA